MEKLMQALQYTTQLVDHTCLPLTFWTPGTFDYLT